MDVLQQYQLWIGFGFAAFLIIFLIVAFFMKERLNQWQVQILRFLCSLCAGFSGGLITGGALFEMSTVIGTTTKVAISGTAGCALFFSVWFSFRVAAKLPDAYNFTVPSSWNFQQTIKAITEQDGLIAEFIGFDQNELSAPLDSRSVRTSTIFKALEAVRLLSNGAIREYDVIPQDHVVQIRIRN